MSRLHSILYLFLFFPHADKCLSFGVLKILALFPLTSFSGSRDDLEDDHGFGYLPTRAIYQPVKIEVSSY
jgi:hypothetical protein